MRAKTGIMTGLIFRDWYRRNNKENVERKLNTTAEIHKKKTVVNGRKTGGKQLVDWPGQAPQRRNRRGSFAENSPCSRRGSGVAHTAWSLTRTSSQRPGQGKQRPTWKKNDYEVYLVFRQRRRWEFTQPRDRLSGHDFSETGKLNKTHSELN